MGIFKETRDIISKYSSISKQANSPRSNIDFSRSGLTIGGSQANYLDEDTAFTIAALHQGVAIISDAIASMNVYLYDYDEDGNIRKLETDYRNYLLNNMANPYLTAFNLKKAMLKDIILHGNGYANVEKNTTEKISSLEYIPASFVIPGADNFGYYYDVTSITTGVTGEIKEPRRIDEFNMLNVVVNPVANSVKGKGILDYAKETLVIANQENTYVKNLFLNGLSAKAILNSKTPFKKETKEKLRQDLLNFYSGSQNAGKMLVLEGDIAVQSLALTPADINLIQNRNLTVTEIARFLNIPKHLLNLDRGQGTYSNITQERLQLIQSTLTPYVTNFQQALNNILLTPAEKKSGYHFSFDANETLKLTPQEQADYLVKLLDSKIMTANEVRRKLNMRPLEETELPADSDIILGEPLNENSDEGIKDGLSISETDANNIEV